MTNKNSLVSVIINVHNGEKYLNECIQSVISQTYIHLEIILYDNYSTDNSNRVIFSFNDKRIKYYKSNKFLKLGEARNNALEVASGEYIAFLDCDDLWMPTKLEKQIKCFNKSEIGFVICNSVFFNNKGHKKILYKCKPPLGKVFSNLISNYFISLETVLIKKSYLDKLDQKFNINFQMIEEYDLFLRLSLICELDYFDEVLAKWRVHEESWTWKKQDLFYKEKKILIQNLNKLIPNFQFKFKKEIYYYVRQYELEESVFNLRLGNNIKARKILKKYALDGFKWFIIYLCTFIGIKFYEFLFTLRGHVKPN